MTATVAGRVVARHERSAHKGSEVLVLDHFLEVLSRKPGALPGSIALAQARSGGGFTAAHERFWQRARRRLGDGAGTRALVEVLLLHRHLPAASVHAALDAVERIGAVDPALVAIEARRIADGRRETAVVERPALRRFERPAPNLAGYDALLAASTSRLAGPAHPTVGPLRRRLSGGVGVARKGASTAELAACAKGRHPLRTPAPARHVWAETRPRGALAISVRREKCSAPGISGLGAWEERGDADAARDIAGQAGWHTVPDLHVAAPLRAVDIEPVGQRLQAGSFTHRDAAREPVVDRTCGRVGTVIVERARAQRRGRSIGVQAREPAHWLTRPWQGVFEALLELRSVAYEAATADDGRGWARCGAIADVPDGPAHGRGVGGYGRSCDPGGGTVIGDAINDLEIADSLPCGDAIGAGCGRRWRRYPVAVPHDEDTPALLWHFVVGCIEQPRREHAVAGETGVRWRITDRVTWRQGRR